MHFDDDRRLHCETGPAVRYSDGWGCHAWHGTRVPGEWIDDPGSLTASDALRQENIEQRRAGIEILGWAKILHDLDGRVIDADVDPEIGTLIEATLPEVGAARFVRVRCGTGREFAVCVPSTIKTALDGQAWMNGLTKKDFVRPEVRA